jgi:hypothetical protein
MDAHLLPPVLPDGGWDRTMRLGLVAAAHVRAVREKLARWVSCCGDTGLTPTTEGS